MESASNIAAEIRQPSERSLSPDIMATILWESAWNALIRAIIFLVLGSVAIGILTNIFREMAPAHPPMTVPLAAQLTRLAVRTILNKLRARWRGLEHFTAFHKAP